MTNPQDWTSPGSGLPEGAPEPLRPAAGAPGTVDPLDRRPPEPERFLIDSSELLGGEIPLRPLAIPEILDGAVTYIRRNTRAVLGVSLLASTVTQVLVSVAAYFYIGDDARDEITPTPVLQTFGAQVTLFSVGLMMSAFVVLLLAGLFAPVMGRTLFGLQTTTRQAWRHARPQVPWLFGMSFALMVISLLAMVVPLLPLIVLIAADGPPVAGVLAGILGVPASLALMVWLYVRYVLAVPAVVMEGYGVVGGMRRAHQLVQGKWWRACGTMLITLLITIFIGFVALQLPFEIIQLVAFGDNPGSTALLLSLAIDTLGRIIAWAVISPFNAGVIALLYIDQRIRREGLDLELRTRPAHEPPPERFMDLWRPSPLVPPPGSGRRRRPGAAPRNGPPLPAPPSGRMPT